MAFIATTPPFRRADRALTTTFPLGAKVMARSSSVGGFASSLPTQVALHASAALRCASPRVTTWTSQSQDWRRRMANEAEIRRQWDSEVSPNRRILRVAAVDRITGEYGTIAEVFHVVDAEPATAVYP